MSKNSNKINILLKYDDFLAKREKIYVKFFIYFL